MTKETYIQHGEPRPVVVMTERGTLRVGYSGKNFIEVSHYPHTIFSALLEREVDRPGLFLKEPLYLGDIPEATRQRVATLIASFRHSLHPGLDEAARGEN